MENKINFVDAQELSRQYPETFYAPSREMISNVKAGDYVKVCANDERFWAEVVRMNESSLTAKVANDLIFNPMAMGSLITVEPRHVHDILQKPMPKKEKGQRHRPKGKGI